jgi:hypothetical protein
MSPVRASLRLDSSKIVEPADATGTRIGFGPTSAP